jgi:hypothetical protein
MNEHEYILLYSNDENSLHSSLCWHRAKES